MLKDFYDLNKTLIKNSLSSFEKIILPLSSGYDSRLVLSGIISNSLNKITEAYTYLNKESIDVYAAKNLSKIAKIFWKHVELPCNFLSTKYLKSVFHIFGSSLHMHAMYQLEFFDEIKKITNINCNLCLTSGFMSGVPGGQHNNYIPSFNESKSRKSLLFFLNNFSQSNFWTKDSIKAYMNFKLVDEYEDLLEQRLRTVYNNFDGEDYQKFIVLDL